MAIPRRKTPRDTGAGSRTILEVPPSTIRIGNNNFPIAGGGYFRLLPYALTSFGIDWANHDGQQVVFYIHPWEIDPGQPRLPVGRLTAWRHYTGIDRVLDRFDRLLTDFAFGTIASTLTGPQQVEVPALAGWAHAK